MGVFFMPYFIPETQEISISDSCEIFTVDLIKVAAFLEFLKGFSSDKKQ